MAKQQEKKTFSPTIQNKKAKFEYHLLETYEAGIALKGTEVKSIRLGKVQFTDAYCYFNDGELFIKELHISPYDFGNINNDDPRRERKLLLKKKQLKRLKEKSEEKGLTIIPVKIFFSDRGFVKVEIALAQGKKLYDKRQDIKDKDLTRESQRGFLD
jgi:SsrA-binding protein